MGEWNGWVGGGVSGPACMHACMDAAPAGEFPRPSMRAQSRISGACMDAALGLIEKLVVKGTKHPTTDGTCVRDYIHVMDLISAHMEAIKVNPHAHGARGQAGRQAGRAPGSLSSVAESVQAPQRHAWEWDCVHFGSSLLLLGKAAGANALPRPPCMLCRLVLQHLANPPPLYNIGTGKGVSVKQFVDACRKVTGKAITVVMQREARAGDYAEVWANVTKIEKDFGWK